MRIAVACWVKTAFMAFAGPAIRSLHSRLVRTLFISVTVWVYSIPHLLHGSASDCVRMWTQEVDISIEASVSFLVQLIRMC